MNPSSDTTVQATSIRDLLTKMPLFQGMKQAHLDLLVASAMRTQFDTGQLIFQKGDPANRFYILLKGAVVLESTDEQGCIHRVQYLEPQEVLGWSWLFPPYYWHFDAVVVEPTDAVFFYGARLRGECEKDHDFGYEIIKRVTQVVISRLQTTRQNWIAAK